MTQPTDYRALSTPELVATLDQAGRVPSQELVSACLERQVELTPHLLELLARPDDPEWEKDDPRLMGPIHAGLLLCEFREPTAIPIIIDLLRRPDALEQGYHEWFDSALMNYGAAALPALAELLHDTSADDFLRGEAATMLGSIAMQHPETAEQVIETLRAALPPLDAKGQVVVSEAEREEVPERWTSVVGVLADLRDTGSQAQVRALFKADLIIQDFIGHLGDYEKQLVRKQGGPKTAILEATDLLKLYDGLRIQEEQDRHLNELMARKKDQRSQLENMLRYRAPEQPQPIQYPGSDLGKPFVRAEAKVGRNDPCPCGSGQKYKRCHGK